jgi:hypothetical protein
VTLHAQSTLTEIVVRTLLLAATIAALPVVVHAAPNPAACNTVVIKAISQIATHRAALPTWQKDIPTLDLVLFDYQASQRGEKTAWNWKPCIGLGDGTNLASLGYIVTDKGQDILDRYLAATHAAHAD